jgi:predicted GIY-YIG superfamily endonuclease
MTPALVISAPGGLVYLIHLDPAYKHARHYTGWTANLDQRLAEHRAGAGARLLDVVQKAGGSWHLVRTWPGTRSLERAIKDMRAVPQLCPECTPHPLPLTRGRAARLVDRSADLVTDPPPLHASPVLDAWVPVPDPAAPVPSVLGGRLAGPEAYQDMAGIADSLIRGWRAEMDADALSLPALALGAAS